MRVLSLCDGIGVAKFALAELGLPVSHYYAAEIDPNPAAIADYNHTDINRTLPEDIRKFGDDDAARILREGEIDLLIGGTPCQSLSVASHKFQGLARLTHKNAASNLFLEFIRIRDLIQPKVAILENVPAPKDCLRMISEKMRADFVLMNSAMMGAQSRKRPYWVSFRDAAPPLISPPQTPSPLTVGDIMLADDDPAVAALKIYDFLPRAKPPHWKWNGISPILIGEIITAAKKNDHYYKGYRHSGNRVYDDAGKSRAIQQGASRGKGGGLYHPSGRARVGFETHSREGKSRALRAAANGLNANTSYPIAAPRQGERVHSGKSPALISNPKDCLRTSSKFPIARTDFQSNRVYSPEGKSSSINVKDARSRVNGLFNPSSAELIARPLCIAECARLQNLPDDYTAAPGISKSAQYRGLGNAMDAAAVKFILSAIFCA